MSDEIEARLKSSETRLLDETTEAKGPVRGSNRVIHSQRQTILIPLGRWQHQSLNDVEHRFRREFGACIVVTNVKLSNEEPFKI